MDDSDEVKRAEALSERLVERALAMDGTCTGEHGVGQGKMKYLTAEYGPAAPGRDGFDQASARPSQHHESGEDCRSFLKWRHRFAAINRQYSLDSQLAEDRAGCGFGAGAGFANHPAWISDRDHSSAPGSAGWPTPDRFGQPSRAVRGRNAPIDRSQRSRNRSDRCAAAAVAAPNIA